MVLTFCNESFEESKEHVFCARGAYIISDIFAIFFGPQIFHTLRVKPINLVHSACFGAFVGLSLKSVTLSGYGIHTVKMSHLVLLSGRDRMHRSTTRLPSSQDPIRIVYPHVVCGAVKFGEPYCFWVACRVGGQKYQNRVFNPFDHPRNRFSAH